MNERILKLAKQSGMRSPDLFKLTVSHMSTDTLEKFAELIVAEAFRAGILYSAKKYAAVGDDRFTGNDVSMFLEMEADELLDDEIKEHFGVEE